jgi:hypothetical protein
MRSARWATILIAACIVVPQLLVAAASPWIGRRAQTWDRAGPCFLSALPPCQCVEYCSPR